MADFTGTTDVEASAAGLFSFLADVDNLPRYFARMTDASRGDGDEVHTTAEMPDGTKVEGKAWFTVDESAQHIAWGSEGSNDYHGYLDVRSKDVGSEVEVHIHTSRVDDGDDVVQEGVDRTLTTIKFLVEQQNVAS